MKLLVCIVPPSMIDDTNRIIGTGQINFQTIVLGTGTAPSEILEYLALGDTDRHVILATVEENDLPSIYRQLVDELDFLKSGRPRMGHCDPDIRLAQALRRGAMK